MTHAQYFAKVAEHMGGWPVSFLAFDLETNGLHGEVLPLEFGWVRVDRGVETSGSITINWADGNCGVDEAWLVATMESTRQAMESRGNQYRFTIDALRAGRHPVEALREVAGLFASARADGHPIAGHNAYKFDLPWLLAAMRRAGVGFAPVQPGEVVDTMLIERGRSRSIDPQKHAALPDPHFVRAAWYDELYGLRVTSNLGHCARSYGVPYDPAAAHGALADSVTVRGLVDAMGVYARNRVVHPVDSHPLFSALNDTGVTTA